VLSVSSTTTLAILTGTELGLAVPDGDPARLMIDMNVEEPVPLQQYCFVSFFRGQAEGQVKTNGRQFCIIAP